jgi:hypothetical protein
MSSGRADSFACGLDHAHVLPHDLAVSKGRPEVRFRFREELIHAAADGRYEERQTGHAVRSQPHLSCF